MTAEHDDLMELKRAAYRLWQWFDDIPEDAFRDNRMMHAAAARKFTFIGQVCERLKTSHPESLAALPDIDEWIGLGKRLADVPVREDEDLLFDTLTHRLPVLVDRVRIMEPDVL